MHFAFGRIRRKTEPTGPGENIELPKYFLKLHETEPTGPGAEAVIPPKIVRLGNRTYRAWGGGDFAAYTPKYDLYS